MHYNRRMLLGRRGARVIDDDVFRRLLRARDRIEAMLKDSSGNWWSVVQRPK